MVGALSAFGLVKGTMDIIGAIFFELMILWFICHRNSVVWPENCKPPKELHPRKVKMVYGNCVSPWALKVYLVLLNIWILVSCLMIIGILWNKPHLLLFWLFWCVGGLLFDGFFLCWWVVEIFTGDAIEAFTNIMISLLTMVIEFGFIFVIYSVYMSMEEGSPELSNEDQSSLLRFTNYIF